MKKILLSLLFLMGISTSAHAATYWLCGNSAGGNWSSTTIWTTINADRATCSGGTGAAPIAGDTADLGTTGGGASGGSVTLSSASAAAIVDETGYTGTLAFGTQTLTITGLFTVTGAMTSTSGTVSTAGGVTFTGTPTGTFPTLELAGSETITWGGFTWPGNVGMGNATYTITNSGAGIITGTFSNFVGTTAGSTVTFSGAYNLSVGYLVLESGNNNRIFTFPASQTLTVTSGATLESGVSIKSGTSSTPFTLTYTGGIANQNIQNVSFTDVTATNALWDNVGGTISATQTRTTGILTPNSAYYGLAVAS